MTTKRASLNCQIGDINLLFAGKCVAGHDPRRRLSDIGLEEKRKPTHLVLNRQVHSNLVLEAEPNTTAEADGLFTDVRGTGLAVVTADCLPVLIVSPESGRIAAVHAGWRGLEAKILSAAASKFTGDSGAQVIAVIGPSIGPCCYEVGWPVAHALVAASGPQTLVPGRAESTTQRPHLDLRQAASAQLQASGIEDVRVSTLCTRCDEAWCSFRRDGAGGGHNVAYVWRS